MNQNRRQPFKVEYSFQHNTAPAHRPPKWTETRKSTTVWCTDASKVSATIKGRVGTNITINSITSVWS